MSKDSAYLADILEAAKAVRRFVSGVTKEQFLANEEKYEAVNHKFEIIGEAPWQKQDGLDVFRCPPLRSRRNHSSNQRIATMTKRVRFLP